jgi:hypothetical protein
MDAYEDSMSVRYDPGASMVVDVFGTDFCPRMREGNCFVFWYSDCPITPRVAYLDAGSVTIGGVPAAPDFTGMYGASNPAGLSEGERITLDATGSSLVPPHMGSVVVGASLPSFTPEPSSITVVDRQQDLSLSWVAPASALGHVVVSLMPNTSAGRVGCWASLSAGRLVIPASVLAHLTAGDATLLLQGANSSLFTVGGWEMGLFVWRSESALAVEVR